MGYPKHIILLIGESGSGKSFTEGKICQSFPDQYRNVISHTSRDIRAGEADGISYHYKTAAWMKRNKDKFAEINEYHGNFYGVSIDELFLDHRTPVAVVEPKGAADIEMWANRNGIRTFIVRFLIDNEMRRENILERDGTDDAFFKRKQSDKAMSEIFLECGLTPNLLITEKKEDIAEFVLSKFQAFLKDECLLSALFADPEQVSEELFCVTPR